MNELNEPGNPSDAAEADGGTVRAIEAMLMVAVEPVPTDLLAQLLEQPVALVERLCAELAAAYDAAGHGFQLVRVAGGYRYQSHPDCAAYVERFLLDGQRARMSPAALETLAIVAYKQPISRAQVSAIRGVNVDGVMRTLQQRGYIAEVGKDPTPGNPSMFATTPLFLEKLGLNDVDELPSLGDFIPGADVVELLEQGLRAESDTDPTPEGAPGDAPEGPDPAATVEVVDAADAVDAAAEVIDVTDHAPIDVDDLIGDGDPLAEG